MKYILVSGTSSGIGKACAEFLSESYHVFATLRSRADAKELGFLDKPNITPVLLDLTREDEIKDAVNLVNEKCGTDGLYALINNAGISCGGPVEFASEENIEKLFQVNFIGQIKMIQSFLPLLRQGSGRIINVSSTNGFTAFPFMGVYSATKFAMDAISNALRIELSPWNIPVSVVYPDKIKSNIWEKALHHSDVLFDQLSPHEKELYRENYRKAHQAITEIEKQALPPKLIAKTILNALKSKKPKRKYFPGAEAKILYFLNKYLSGSFIDKLIVKQLEIK